MATGKLTTEISAPPNAGSMFEVEEDEDLDEEDGEWDDTPAEKLQHRPTIMPMGGVDDLADEAFKDNAEDRHKTQEEVHYIIDQIRDVILFKGYQPDELQSFIDFMYTRRVTAGESVIRQGDEGDAFYVVKNGHYRCHRQHADGTISKVCEYRESGFFGELALIHDEKRAASITAITDGELYVLNAVRFMWLKKKQAMGNADRFTAAIGSIPMFRTHLDSKSVSRLIDGLELLHLQPGDVICRQGEFGDAMFFVLEGEIEADIDGHVVRVMREREFFGERALILNERRAATCTVTTKTKLARLSKENFSLLIPDIIVSKMKEYMATAYKNTGSTEESFGLGVVMEIDDDN